MIEAADTKAKKRVFFGLCVIGLGMMAFLAATGLFLIHPRLRQLSPWGVPLAVALSWSVLAYLAAGLLLSFMFLKRTFPDLTDRQRSFKLEAKKILGFSWPLAFVGFFNVVMFQINTIMLGYFSTSQDIGIFGAVQRTSFAIQIIQASFNPIFAPIVADLFNRRKFSKSCSSYKRC